MTGSCSRLNPLCRGSGDQTHPSRIQVHSSSSVVERTQSRRWRREPPSKCDPQRLTNRVGGGGGWGDLAPWIRWRLPGFQRILLCGPAPTRFEVLFPALRIHLSLIAARPEIRPWWAKHRNPEEQQMSPPCLGFRSIFAFWNLLNLCLIDPTAILWKRIQQSFRSGSAGPQLCEHNICRSCPHRCRNKGALQFTQQYFPSQSS